MLSFIPRQTLPESSIGLGCLPVFEELLSITYLTSTPLLKSMLISKILRCGSSTTPHHKTAGEVSLAIRRTARSLIRSIKIPLLSVVIYCENDDGPTERTVRNVLNQSLRDLEAIVVVDRGASASKEVVRALSRRDSRLRLHILQEKAGELPWNAGVKKARGLYYAFLNVGDLIATDAYEVLTNCLVESKSDFGLVDAGYTPALPHSATEAHFEVLLSESEQFQTQVLGTFLPQLDLRRMTVLAEFWKRNLQALPDSCAPDSMAPVRNALIRATKVLYSSSILLSLGTIDSERTRPSAEESLLRLDQFNATVRTASSELKDRPDEVLEYVYCAWAEHLIESYLPGVGHTFDSYENSFRNLACYLVSVMPKGTWKLLPFWDRLALWVGSNGTLEDLYEVVAAPSEDSRCLPLTPTEHSFIITAPVLKRLPRIPPHVTSAVDRDLTLQLFLLRQPPHADEVDVAAYVPGLASEHQPDISFTFKTSSGNVTSPIRSTQHLRPEIDYFASDPWRSYASMAFSLKLPMRDDSTVRLVAHATVKGIRLTTSIALTLNAKPPETVLIVETIQVRDSALQISGRNSTYIKPERLVMSASSHQPSTPVEISEDTWHASFDLSDPSIPSGGYFLQWAETSGSALRDTSGYKFFDQGTRTLYGPVRNVSVRTNPDWTIALTLGPPLNGAERTARGQRLLIDSPAPALQPSILFENFSGKGTSGNPGALYQDLRQHHPDLQMWWSVNDGSVSVPEGAATVTRRSSKWFEILQSAKVLVTDNDFPHWFEKQPDQYLIQTWHGTTIKRLAFDAPPSFIPLTYRRLIEKQASQWDVLLAQSASAAKDFRSAFKYTGEIYIGEYPRNVKLLEGSAKAQAVRDQLELEGHTPIILYAPTWRHRKKGGLESTDIYDLLDPSALADSTGATVLVRSHHMNSLTASGSNVRDVTTYPDVEELFLVADVLVSDYSSVFYDFALTGRPAVVFAPDLEWYRNVERGFYNPDWPSGTPWPLTRTQEQLITQVRGILQNGKLPLKLQSNSAPTTLEWLRSSILNALET